MTEVDVVVVGAGCAGLAAAKSLRAAGLSFRVVEAMDRIGGRAWTTTTDFGVPFDIGCAWLHAADRNPFFPEAQDAGWTLQHHDMGLDHLWFGRRRASDAEMAAEKPRRGRACRLHRTPQRVQRPAVHAGRGLPRPARQRDLRRADGLRRG